MIEIKTQEEIDIMTEGGKRLGSILSNLMSYAAAGINLLDIEKKAMNQITKEKGKPSFPTVEGYNWATCLCVNDEIVHGIPRKYSLLEDDVLTIDIGMIYKGFHVDAADSKLVSSRNSPIRLEREKFLNAGRTALERAIQKAKKGNRVGHISQTIQSTIEQAGYSIVKTLVGHGVGVLLHEEPQIPGFIATDVERTPILEQGMTIAIEVIYAYGKGSMVYKNTDGWTLSTRDESLSAVFEHSVAITEHGPIVLTNR